jgi:nickel-dependent lactate racemase
MKIELPSNIWYGDEPIVIETPESWEVTICRMSGDEKRALSKDEIKKAIREPLNSKPLEKLAEERGEAVIIFDDMTRPTKIDEIAPIVLEELKKGGVKDENIVFVCANGAHGTYDREDFEKKLGKEIVEKYPVFNHNAYDNLDYLGDTSSGTPVEINSEVVSYSLKIAIGCILPHPQFGYSGGSKIILPGVAGIRTIAYNHGVIGGWSSAMRIRDLHPTCQMAYGRVNEENVMRKDSEEAAEMAGLDFTVNVLVKTNRDTTDVFAGHFIDVQRKGVEVARKHYSTSLQFECDAVIANAYSKASEAAIATWTTLCLKPGGTLVLICNSKTGQVSHYIHGRWGMRRKGGLLYLPPPETLKRAGKIVFVSEYPEKQQWLEMLDERAVKVKTWEEALEELENVKKVAVFPDATIQKAF